MTIIKSWPLAVSLLVCFIFSFYAIFSTACCIEVIKSNEKNRFFLIVMGTIAVLSFSLVIVIIKTLWS